MRDAMGSVQGRGEDAARVPVSIADEAIAAALLRRLSASHLTVLHPAWSLCCLCSPGHLVRRRTEIITPPHRARLAQRTLASTIKLFTYVYAL